MSIDVLKRAGLFIAYVLVQAMVLGRIHLFGFATPLLYVYFVVKFPRNYPKWGILLWSFSLGLAIDIFCNTPGGGSRSSDTYRSFATLYLPTLRATRFC